MHSNCLSLIHIYDPFKPVILRALGDVPAFIREFGVGLGFDLLGEGKPQMALKDRRFRMVRVRSSVRFRH